MTTSMRALLSVVSVVTFAGAGCAASPDGEVVGDGEPLVIAVEEPAPGAFIEGRSMRVRGHVEGPAGAIEIDGRRVDLGEGGAFDVNVAVEPGARRLELRARGGGQEAAAYAAAIVGDFRPADARITNAASIELGPSALDALSVGAADMIAHQDLDGLLGAANPVMSDTWGEIDVTSVEHGAVDVRLRPEQGALVVEATLHDLRIGISVHLNGMDPAAGELVSTEAHLEAPLAVAMQDGQPAVSAQGATLALDGFSFSVDHLASSISDNQIVRDGVRAKIEEDVQTILAQKLPVFMQATLAGLPTSGQLDVVGAQIGYSAQIASVSVTSAGLAASVDLGLSPVAPLPGRQARGSLLLERGAPPVTGTSGVGLSVALDTLNALATTLWSAGRLDLHVARVPFGDRTLTVGALALVSGRLARGMDPDVPMSLDIHPALPPVAQVGENGAIELVLADVSVEMLADTGDGAPQHLMTVSAFARVSITPRVADGAITMDIGNVDLVLDGIDARPREVAALTTLVHDLLLPRMAGLLDLGGFRVPSLHGFSVDAESLAASGGYVTFVGDVRYASPAM